MLNVSRESCQEKGPRNRFVEGIYIFREKERDREKERSCADTRFDENRNFSFPKDP